MIEESQPDVVMTDIKMPYMDGMELCSHIRREYPAMKIVRFYRFDEFEYAKEAVHLEVEEYILKPVNSVELINIFTKLKIKLDQEISERRAWKSWNIIIRSPFLFCRLKFLFYSDRGKDS